MQEATKPTGMQHKNKRLIHTKIRILFFLYTPHPHLSLPLMLCCSDEYYPSKPQLLRNLSFLATLCHLLISLFPSTPCVSTAPQSYFSFSLSFTCFFFFLFFPYLIFLPLTYVDLILPHYNDFRFGFSCRPIKSRQQQQQRGSFLFLRV